MKFYCLVEGEKIIQIQNKMNESFLTIELDKMEDYVNYKYNGTSFIKINEEEKKKLYPFLFEEPTEPTEPKTLDDVIKDNLKTMIMTALPEGETLTKENVPTLVDIINPSKQKNTGTQTNPIVIVDNDIAHNGYLCTYGKYYKWNDVLYHCERRGESEGGTIKLFYTPDQLIGHYFVTV